MSGVADWMTAVMGHRADVIDDLVPDSLWERAAPLLPARPARRYRYLRGARSLPRL
jgi:hypothetical protein